MSKSIAPNDPLFWLHHCFIDKLWTDYQILHPDIPFDNKDYHKNKQDLPTTLLPWKVSIDSIYNHTNLCII